nr:unnamed protein product [Callosobruchus chinensis]CAH7720033.1 unnamed protein product [Callosobruchus chinensis]CAH7732356.1 unnamed protein product [Callosobruchus chinensis]CAH7739031.1 unnamed protein product [Callosobruchus chinensis]CAH7747053.1 unnamed protein product [Callosobruchus chinensis]
MQSREGQFDSSVSRP